MGWVSTCTQKCSWKNTTVSEKKKKQLAKCIILWETHKPWISLDFKSVIKHPFKGDSPGHNLLVLFWLVFLFYFQWQRNPSEMSFVVIAGDCLPEKKKKKDICFFKFQYVSAASKCFSNLLKYLQKQSICWDDNLLKNKWLNIDVLVFIPKKPDFRYNFWV